MTASDRPRRRESTRTSRGHGALKRRTAPVPRKLSRLHKPETMSLEAWQIALRRQVGPEETFTLTNVGDQPIYCPNIRPAGVHAWFFAGLMSVHVESAERDEQQDLDPIGSSRPIPRHVAQC